MFDARAYCVTDGAASTASWLRGRCRVSGNEAAARVKTARTMRELPATTAALAADAIALAHARSIAMLADETDVHATRDVEEHLVTLAALLDPVRFSIELRRIRDAWRRDGADGDDTETPDDPDDAFRRLSVAASFEGRFNLNGWLTPEGGALLKAALDALAKPVADDPRTHPQRYADALVELARRQMNNGDLPAKNGVRPHLFIQATAQPAPRTSVPQVGQSRLQLIDARTVGGGVLTDRALERLACDATVSRVLFVPDGHVLDLGRSSRVVSAAQWKALLLRDGGCVIPGHDCPVAATEAHHLVSWLDYGPTNLPNLAQVCTFGHKMLHEYGFTLYLNKTNRWVLGKPDGTEMIGMPLGQTRHGKIASIGEAMANGPRGPCGD